MDFETARGEVRSDGEMTILTGLLSQKNLNVVVDESTHCIPLGQLVDWPQALLKLAICYGRALFSTENGTERDRATIARNMIALLWEEQEKVAWIIQQARRYRILRHWVLVDGGTEMPRTVFGAAFLTAGRITIYDRFFRQYTLDAIRDAMDFAMAERGEPLGCDLTLCVGESGGAERKGYVDYSSIPGMLRRYLSGRGRVSLETIIRPKSGRLSLHDRFIQIDEASTFVFTAGIGCFFEGIGAPGPNRSCHIFECAVGEECEEFEFEVYDGRARGDGVSRRK